MKRYDCDTEYNNGVMSEQPDGEYVKLEDVVAFLKDVKNSYGCCPEEDMSLVKMQIDFLFNKIGVKE